MAAFDIVIIGAGIVGTAAARECIRAGMRVGLVEQHVTGGGITAAGMGHVVVMDDSPAQLALTTFSRQLWLDEAATLPSSVEYESRGTIWVAADEEEMAEVYARQATYAQFGVLSTVLDARELAAEEPNLTPGLAGGLLVPNDGVVYPPAAAEFYLRQALAAGAVAYADKAIRASRGRVDLAGGTQLLTDRIVLATGADTSLLPALQHQLHRRKGHLVITDRYPGFARHQLVELGYLKSAHKLVADSVAFNIQPRQTGQMLIGSSRQYGSADPATDPAILARMLDRAAGFMPGISALSALRIWTGFRAATPDKLPLIGPAAGLSDDPGLWLAVGFEGLGITNAPAAGRLLADSVLGRPSAIDLTPYLPARLLAPLEAAHG